MSSVNSGEFLRPSHLFNEVKDKRVQAGDFLESERGQLIKITKVAVNKNIVYGLTLIGKDMNNGLRFNMYFPDWVGSLDKFRVIRSGTPELKVLMDAREAQCHSTLERFLPRDLSRMVFGYAKNSPA